MEIFTFFCIMQMREVMTVVPLKQYNTQSRISLEILKQCSSNLAPETNIIKEGKWHSSCCCHDNSYAADPVLIKTKIPRFWLKQGSPSPSNLAGELRQYGNHVCSGQEPLTTTTTTIIYLSTLTSRSTKCSFIIIIIIMIIEDAY